MKTQNIKKFKKNITDKKIKIKKFRHLNLNYYGIESYLSWY